MEQHNRSLKVATYNIRKCIGLDRRRRPGRVLDVLSALEADVVALQEADRRLGKRPSSIPRDLVAEHTDLVPVDLNKNDESLGWHGNAILVRKGTKITKTDHLDLPGLEPRGAVLVEFETQGRRIRIVGTHLGLTRKMRRAQLGAITAAVQSRTAMATMIMGDFNEWSSATGLEPLAANFQIHAPGRSYHSARPMAALDRIAVDCSLELRDGGVDETPLAQKTSDHLPVWARFKFAK